MGRILITDDNLFFRTSFRSALASRLPGVAIDEAANARETMERIDLHVPDLIFVDIHLPEMNGLELTKRIKELHPKITVTVFTGYDLPEYEHAALASGASHYLVKSTVTGEGIAALVKTVLTEKGLLP